MAGVRTVTLTISSTCKSPEGHQPGFLQVSVDDTWIPPEPMPFPPAGGGGRDTELQRLAEAVQGAMRAAEQVRGSGIGFVGPVTDPGRGTEGDTGRCQISFVARNEVNIGVSKDQRTPTVPQINLEVEVEEGQGDFDVKVLRPVVLFDIVEDLKKKKAAGAAGGAAAGAAPRDPPKRTPHDRLRVKSGQDARVRTNRRPKRSKQVKKKRKWWAVKYDALNVFERTDGEESEGCVLPPSIGHNYGGMATQWGLFTEDYEPLVLSWEPERGLEQASATRRALDARPLPPGLRPASEHTESSDESPSDVTAAVDQGRGARVGGAAVPGPGTQERALNLGSGAEAAEDTAVPFGDVAMRRIEGSSGT